MYKRHKLICLIFIRTNKYKYLFNELKKISDLIYEKRTPKQAAGFALQLFLTLQGYSSAYLFGIKYKNVFLKLFKTDS